MKTEGKCTHFTGIQKKCCEIGINYKKQFGVGSLPCIKKYANGCTCAKYQEPTAEEVAETKEAFKRATERFTKVAPLCSRIRREKKGQNWNGVEECPVCKGKLHLSHAAYNGHIHGACETDGCVRWIE